MTKLKVSWQLTKSSIKVIAKDKELTVISLFGFIAIMLPLLAYTLAIYSSADSASNGSNSAIGASTETFGDLGIVIIAALGLFTSLVSVFTSAAICHGAIRRFNGFNPTLAECLSAAWQSKQKLIKLSGLFFAADSISGTIGNQIGQQASRTAFSFATYLAIPAIMFHGNTTTLTDDLKHSLMLVKKTWGEATSIYVGVTFVGATLAGLSGLAVVLSGLFWLINAGFGSILSVLFLLSISIVVPVVIMIIFSTLNILAKTALFFYASTGLTPPEFTDSLHSMTKQNA